MLRRTLLLSTLSGSVLIPALGRAAVPPLVPPCGGPPSPAYPAAGQPPVAQIWTEADLKSLGWQPPSCLPWAPVRTRLVAALAGQFQSTASADQLAARLTQMSALPSIRYWSTSDKAWKPLASQAGMLSSAEGAPVPDPAPSDLQAGRTLYYFEVGRAGRTVYRLSVLERSSDRIVVATENVTAMRVAIVTAFEPGALQSAIFLERRAAGAWGYYQVMRATEGASTVAMGKDASYLNRLAALYRYTAGIPTDQEPPIAR
ncbi:MAG: hypothetical protein JWQ58_1770 [Reyranella sp.]|nr:hypothetical protein [Reyranella sp.]